MSLTRIKIRLVSYPETCSRFVIHVCLRRAARQPERLGGMPIKLIELTSY
jgi:hypothetical protein